MCSACLYSWVFTYVNAFNIVGAKHLRHIHNPACIWFHSKIHMCSSMHNPSRYTFAFTHGCTSISYARICMCLLRIRAGLILCSVNDNLICERCERLHQTDPCERIRNESPNPLILSSPIVFVSFVFNHLQLSLRHLHFSYCVIWNHVANSIHRNAERNQPMLTATLLVAIMAGLVGLVVTQE